MKNSDISELYKTELDTLHESNLLHQSSLLCSQEKKSPKQYVQDVLKSNSMSVIGTLNSGGTIYICGSISMWNEVLKEIAKILSENGSSTIVEFMNQDQILSDCY
jgi:sulfite reductase (NADPH) flavoprotein alpha-component